MTDEHRLNEQKGDREPSNRNRPGENHTTETAQEARQGRRGVPILLVLVIGLVLAVIAWWGVGFYGARIDENQTNELPKASDQPLEAPQASGSQSDQDAASPEAAEPPEQESRSPDAQ